MTLKDHQVVEQAQFLLDGHGHDAVGLLLALERRLEAISAPEVSWFMESGETGLMRSLIGCRRDLLCVKHDRFNEYTAAISARPLGSVLQVSWLLLASPRITNDLRRLFRLGVERGSRFEIGSELDLFEMIDLSGFVSLTRLAVRRAIGDVTDCEETRPAPDSPDDLPVLE